MAGARLDVVRVFVGPDGRGGNPLGVFLDAAGIDPGLRQSIAAHLGFSETVFVPDRRAARLRILTPALELPLAGHPLVGTAWLLHRDGLAPRILRPPAGEVPTWREGGLTWIRARPEWAPEFDFLEADSADEVGRMTAAPDGGGRTVVWAWRDRRAGAVRTRAFLPAFGVAEDEATGAAALRLCRLLGRAITITQGEASVLHARPATGGTVALGGRVEPVEWREYEIPG